MYLQLASTYMQWPHMFFGVFFSLFPPGDAASNTGPRFTTLTVLPPLHLWMKPSFSLRLDLSVFCSFALHVESMGLVAYTRNKRVCVPSF